MYPGLVIEPAAEYHAKATQYMSSHKLSRLRKGETHEPPADNPNFQLGRWVHTYVLEGDSAFFESCVVAGKTNPKTGRHYSFDTVAHREFASRFADYEVVPPVTYDQLRDMREAVLRVPAARELLLGGGAPELVGRGDYFGVPCQIRCDWLTWPTPRLVDLKTCRALENFKTDALRYDYLHQLAFYREMLRLITGLDFEVFIIAVQKGGDPKANVYALNRSQLEAARLENEATLLAHGRHRNGELGISG